MNTHEPQPQRDDIPDPPPADVLAGEYVLGVLDAKQRREAQARIEREPAFARLVEGWEHRFAPLAEEIMRVESMRVGSTPVEPPAYVWPRIRTRIGWAPVEGDRAPRMWRRVGFWQAATGMATAAAIAAVFLGRVEPPPTQLPPPVVVAQPQPSLPVTTLARDDGSAGWLASIDAANGKLMLMPVSGPADDAGRVPELWLIPEGEAPRSLGLLPSDVSREVEVPKDLARALIQGSVLAVTLEPPGGAPNGVPSGPIVAKGGIVRI
jgi:anti-sigma-K factor RskA